MCVSDLCFNTQNMFCFVNLVCVLVYSCCMERGIYFNHVKLVDNMFKSSMSLLIFYLSVL